MPEGYEIGLFLHLLGVFLLGGAALVSFAVFSMMRRAATVQEVRVFGGLGRILSQHYVLPILGAWMIVTGLYLVGEFELDITDGWIFWSIIAVLVAIANGLANITPRMKAIGGEAGPAPDGPVPASITDKLNDPFLFGGMHFNLLLTVGIIWNMVMAPGWFGSLLALIIFGGIGAGSAYPMYAKQQAAGGGSAGIGR